MRGYGTPLDSGIRTTTVGASSDSKQREIRTLMKSQAAREYEEVVIESTSLRASPVNKRRFHEGVGRTNSAGIGDKHRIATHQTKQSKISTADRWIEETIPSAMRSQTTSFPQLRLELFDGDVMKWSDFAGR